MLKYLIEKEFKQIRRNSFLPRLILFMPCLTMLVLPWAASMEVRNINLAVVDNDRSAYSGRLTEKASASAYFNLVDVASSYEEAMKGVESGQTDIILEIPEKFERRLTTEGAAQGQVLPCSCFTPSSVSKYPRRRLRRPTGEPPAGIFKNR